MILVSRAGIQLGWGHKDRYSTGPEMEGVNPIVSHLEAGTGYANWRVYRIRNCICSVVLKIPIFYAFPILGHTLTVIPVIGFLQWDLKPNKALKKSIYVGVLHPVQRDGRDLTERWFS